MTGTDRRRMLMTRSGRDVFPMLLLSSEEKMDYYKLENGQPNEYRQPIRTETADIFTTDPAVLAQYGYYPLRYSDAPEVDETHTAVPRWEMGEGEIVQDWTVEEIPAPEADPGEAGAAG